MNAAVRYSYTPRTHFFVAVVGAKECFSKKMERTPNKCSAHPDQLTVFRCEQVRKLGMVLEQDPTLQENEFQLQ